jgi:hypothetical protein
MANFDTLITDSVNVDDISRNDGTKVIDVGNFSEIYVRQNITQVDYADRSTGTTWLLGPTFPIITGCRPGSQINLY